MSETPEKTQEMSAEKIEELTETPVFGRFRAWWRAKKCSLDFWGFEKYLGVDNSAFKNALNTYKSLLAEIDEEYESVAKSPDSPPEAIEEARTRRDQGLLDAKRDFVYGMPDAYRVWFKKRKIFSSWRVSPESWGFEESRYWGSRSGLGLHERRIVVGTLFLGMLAIGFWIYTIATHETEEETVKEFTVEKSTENVDSIYQAKRLAELRRAEEVRRRNLEVWRKDRIINEINEGTYTTSTKDMRADLVEIMQLYVENVYKLKITEEDIPSSHVRASMALIGRNNPQTISKRDEFGIPAEWTPNRRVKLAWSDISTVLDRLYGRKR